MIVRGRNSLTLSAADEGTWIVTLQLARRRTLDQASAGFKRHRWEAGTYAAMEPCGGLRVLSAGASCRLPCTACWWPL
jgi:hypothetical protein